MQIGTKQWRYYDYGPKTVPPLICIPGIAGTADVYYKQIMALSMKVVFKRLSANSDAYMLLSFFGDLTFYIYRLKL